MNIKALGPLSVHPDDDEWLISQPIPIPYLDGLALAFTIVVFDGMDESQVESSVDAFLSLTGKDRRAAALDVFRSYKETQEHYGDELDFKIDSEENVWDFVRPTGISVHPAYRDAYRDVEAHVCIEAECGWDVEHGLEIAYKNGHELAKVMQQGEDFS